MLTICLLKVMSCWAFKPFKSKTFCILYLFFGWSFLPFSLKTFCILIVFPNHYVFLPFTWYTFIGERHLWSHTFVLLLISSYHLSDKRPCVFITFCLLILPPLSRDSFLLFDILKHFLFLYVTGDYKIYCTFNDLLPDNFQTSQSLSFCV